MLERVVSGGQTGVDQAGWRAAQAAGIATGGWMPRGFRTEDGPRPELAERYGARELPGARYPDRTRANVRDSGATLWLGATGSSGAKTTLAACRRLGRPHLIIPTLDPPTVVSEVAAWLRDHGIRVLNVAGSRESVEPGIGARAEGVLAAVFAQVARG